jgi:hypothetical protein
MNSYYISMRIGDSPEWSLTIDMPSDAMARDYTLKLVQSMEVPNGSFVLLNTEGRCLSELYSKAACHVEWFHKSLEAGAN